MTRPTTIRTLLDSLAERLLRRSRVVPGDGPGISGRGRSRPGCSATVKGWQKGKGWGWIWGKDDEVGVAQRPDRTSRGRRRWRWRHAARSSTWA